MGKQLSELGRGRDPKKQFILHENQGRAKYLVDQNGKNLMSKPLSSSGVREQPVMYRRTNPMRPGDQIEAFNRQYLMPEVSALAGKPKWQLAQTQSEVGYARPQKTPIPLKAKKKSKSPSP